MLLQVGVAHGRLPHFLHLFLHCSFCVEGEPLLTAHLEGASHQMHANHWTNIRSYAHVSLTEHLSLLLSKLGYLPALVMCFWACVCKLMGFVGGISIQTKSAVLLQALSSQAYADIALCRQQQLRACAQFAPSVSPSMTPLRLGAGLSTEENGV